MHLTLLKIPASHITRNEWKDTPRVGFLHNESLSFLSGNFKYRFTVPGVYYYSSGYIDDGSSKVLQGVVKVLPREDESKRITVSVSGVEARLVPGGRSAE